MEFYREVLGGKLEIHTIADFGSPDSPHADKVMHAQLDTPYGHTLIACDADGQVERDHLDDQHRLMWPR
ncbi:hypothetical protein [Amycolatopsis orientalis]|uniref:hypothetical protein n=1 Tax=Amycolatopsis orientalis TaxID=31958 RepID=UPI0003FAF94D|nr:hypothetical protein [Amycolatopsis orientalis]